MSTSATAAAAGHHTAPASHQPCRASASSPLEQRCNRLNQTLVEYLWLSADGQELRSKTRVLDAVPSCLEDVPDWVVEVGVLSVNPRAADAFVGGSERSLRSSADRLYRMPLAVPTATWRHVGIFLKDLAVCRTVPC